MIQVPIKAVIFDMDGVIFDSERAMFDLWMEYAAIHHLENSEALYYKSIGVNWQSVKKILTDYYGEDFPFDSYIRETSIRFEERYGGGKLPEKEGVRSLLDVLKARNIKTAIASSSKKDAVEKRIGDAGLRDYFQVVIGGDMVSESKPHPEIFLKAAAELGVKPEEAIVIEDSYNGIRAAFAGGMRPVMVPDIIPPDKEMEEKSWRICNSLLDVIPLINA